MKTLLGILLLILNIATFLMTLEWIENKISKFIKMLKD